MCTPIPRKPTKLPRYEFFLLYYIERLQYNFVTVYATMLSSSDKYYMRGGWILMESGLFLVRRRRSTRHGRQFVSAAFSSFCG